MLPFDKLKSEALRKPTVPNEVVATPSDEINSNPQASSKDKVRVSKRLEGFTSFNTNPKMQQLQPGSGKKHPRMALAESNTISPLNYEYNFIVVFSANAVDL